MNHSEMIRHHDYSRWIVTAIALALLSVWEIIGSYNSQIDFLLSRPSQISKALADMAMSGELLLDVGITSSEALLGTALGTIFGSLLGLALWLSKRGSRISAPFIVVAANFPVFALAPAAIVWLGIGVGMKVFLAAFATFFVSLSLSHRGAMKASEEFGGVFDGFGASRWDSYRKVIVPGALDSVFSSMQINIGLGILGAFIGEFIASDRGLGHTIIRASGLYRIDRVFAASLCIIFLAILFDRLACGIQQEKRTLARLFGVPKRLRVRSRYLSEEFTNE